MDNFLYPYSVRVFFVLKIFDSLNVFAIIKIGERNSKFIIKTLDSEIL